MLQSFHKCSRVSDNGADGPKSSLKLILSGDRTQAFAIVQGPSSAVSFMYQNLMLQISESRVLPHTEITGVSTAFFISTRNWKVDNESNPFKIIEAEEIIKRNKKLGLS